MSASTPFPRLFRFQSGRNPRLFAFAPDRAGANLPGALGPWREAGTAPPAVGGLIREAIEARGFFLARADGVAW